MKIIISMAALFMAISASAGERAKVRDISFMVGGIDPAATMAKKLSEADGILGFTYPDCQAAGRSEVIMTCHSTVMVKESLSCGPKGLSPCDE